MGTDARQRAGDKLARLAGNGLDLVRFWREASEVLAGAVPHYWAPCWYTLTPDENFVVGPHPAAPRVMLACGFSGHGFKFTPVLGEALADLVADGSTRHDLATFDPRRFAG